MGTVSSQCRVSFCSINPSYYREKLGNVTVTLKTVADAARDYAEAIHLESVSQILPFFLNFPMF